MKHAKKLLALLLALVMCVGLIAGCSGQKAPESSAPVESQSAEPSEEPKNNVPLVVGYAPFSSKFSPFFAATAYDQDVYTMTQLGLLTSDRTGAIILKGIEGETHSYNGTDYTYHGPADCTITENADGTVYYDFVLRDDITFSDGEPVTIDDVIFSMYVLCDPTYDGSSTLYGQPILGLAEYRENMTTLAALLASLGEDNTDFTYVTEEQQTAFWAAVNDGLVKFAQEIVDYCVSAGAAADANDVATAAAAWGFELEAGATAISTTNQKVWNM